MEYLIATIVIMLFCIAALAQEKSPESAIISRNNPKPLKAGKAHVKKMAKHICAPAFTDLPKLTGVLCLNAVPINGGRAVSLYLPACYGHVTVPQSPRPYRYQLLYTVGTATKTGGYMAILPQFKPAKFIWQSILFCHKKITT